MSASLLLKSGKSLPLTTTLQLLAFLMDLALRSPILGYPAIAQEDPIAVCFVFLRSCRAQFRLLGAPAPFP